MVLTYFSFGRDFITKLFCEVIAAVEEIAPIFHFPQSLHAREDRAGIGE